MSAEVQEWKSPAPDNAIVDDLCSTPTGPGCGLIKDLTGYGPQGRGGKGKFGQGIARTKTPGQVGVSPYRMSLSRIFGQVGVR